MLSSRIASSISEKKQILRNFDHLKISRDNIKFINFDRVF